MRRILAQTNASSTVCTALSKSLRLLVKTYLRQLSSFCLPFHPVKCLRVLWRVYVYVHIESSVCQHDHQVWLWLYVTPAVLQDAAYLFMAGMCVGWYCCIYCRSGLQWMNGYLSLTGVHNKKKDQKALFSDCYWLYQFISPIRGHLSPSYLSSALQCSQSLRRPLLYSL